MTQAGSNFSELGLAESLLNALRDLQFTVPSPIQQQTIPWLLQGRDIVGLAQTGTGKTAAFGLPILHNLKPTNTPQAIILAPTRELAIQVADHIKNMGKYVTNLRLCVLCGGQDYRPQLKALRDGANVIVGTPGRVLDHLERKSLDLSEIATIVLDEADEMLRMGFIEDVETVLSKLPEKRQIALLSATMPPRIRQIAQRYLNDPVSVEIRSATATATKIEQKFLFAGQHEKPAALLRVLAVEDVQSMIVFVRTKSSTEEVASSLQQYGHRAQAIHGDLSQNIRERIIQQFRQGAITILVATDVAARGLDVDRVTHVINYDMVNDCETYVHRIGRTGRAGRDGVTILFATHKEARMLHNIERHTRAKLTKISIPDDTMIAEAQEKRFLEKLSQRIASDRVENYQQRLAKWSQEINVSTEQIAAALALWVHEDQAMHKKLPSASSRAPLKSTKDARDRREPRSDRNERRFDSANKGDFSRRDSSRKDFSRKDSGREYGRDFNNNYSNFSNDISSEKDMFRLDVGRIHGVKPGNIVGAIANEAGLPSREITGLKIHDDYSVVCLPKGMPKNVIQSLMKAWVCGRQLQLRLQKAK